MTNVFHVGVDVGGTFTDLVCVSDDGTMTATKVPNVGDDPSTDVCAGLDDLADRLEVSRQEFYGAIEVIVHGTTVATNAILTGRIARTGLITTLGFRDALEMRRGIRERLYDNKYTPPPPLVPRYLRLGVRERIDAAGRIVDPLDEGHLREALAELRGENVESVAVCFLHAYRNPAHEAQAADVIAAEWPDVHVSLSHAVLSERRFYERISTTAINAAVGPILATYLRHLLAELGERGFGGALRVMKSNGGLMSPEVAAAREAAHTLLSGPAGAVAGGTAFSRMQGNANLIVMDMGGTSCDVCLIEEGTSLVTREGSVARYRLMLPMLDIHTVGAGGGSIARVDEAGLLEVGPASAGSHPGPACYQRGRRVRHGHRRRRGPRLHLARLLPGAVVCRSTAISPDGPSARRSPGLWAPRNSKRRRECTTSSTPRWGPPSERCRCSAATTRGDSCCSQPAAPVPSTSARSLVTSGSAG